ncbi:hypothetical protein BDV33DRAFT_198820 [Aspergillus novoparasiticus]|uniref:Acyl carrier protein n=1 Tax=Aspergillus novoparasiticus TaxID=986946 RepID=A0A5N6F9B7_9EURO|nr:hypothetical protein BDV33DRAFT_198820 [Aspergillus novoparasiticus]
MSMVVEIGCYVLHHAFLIQRQFFLIVADDAEFEDDLGSGDFIIRAHKKAFETEFGVQIEDEDARGLRYLNDVVKYFKTWFPEEE